MPSSLYYDRVGHVAIIAQLVFRVMSSGTSQQTTLGDNGYGVAAVCIPSTSTNEQSEPKQKRWSYTREKKLEIVSFYKETNNMYKTCQEYNINSKNLLCWAKQEKEIKRSKGGRRYNYSLQLASILIFGMFVFYRRVGFDWSAKFLELEEKLHSEFQELRRKGIKVKGWWFKARAKEIFILITPSNTHKDGTPDSKSDTKSALEEH